MASMHKKMAELVVKQLTGDISEEETIELNHIRAESGLSSKAFDELQDITYLASQLKLLNSFDLKASWEKVEAAYSFRLEKESVWKFACRVAAFMVLGISAWLCWQLSKPPYKNSLTSKGWEHSVATGASDSSLSLMAAEEKREQSSIVDSCINFEDSDLQSIIHQLPGGGEYKVEYAAAIPRVMYTGALSRTTPVDALVQLVQLQSAYTITLEGKKIMVHL